MLEDKTELVGQHAAWPLPSTGRGEGGTAELVDAALAALERGEEHVLVAEKPGLLGRCSAVEHVRAVVARRGVPVLHCRATCLDRAVPLSTLVVALGMGGSGASSWEDLDGNRMTVLERVRRRLVHLANGRGLLVCLDDFHRADEFTALALRVLVPALASTPVLWLLSLRPSQASAAVRAVVNVLLEAGAWRLPPVRLTEDDVRRLCARVLGAEPDPAVVALAAGTGRDPELVERVLRALRDAGHVRVADGRAEVVDDERLPLPDWLVTEVRSVLDDLAEPVTALVEAGAVLGREFTVHEAAALLRRPVTELVSAAGEAVEAGVLVPGATALGFCGELVRRVVYAGLAEPVRMALHREAADIVAGEGHPAEEILDHVERGGHRGSAAAVAAMRRAVRSAGDAGEAANLALRLLDLLGETHPASAELTVETVQLLDAAGRGGEGWDLAVRALHRVPDAEAETRLVCALGALVDIHDRSDDHVVVEYARRALARQELTEQQRADLTAVQAYRLAEAGHTDAAQRAAERARAAHGEAVVLGSAARAQVALRRGRFTRALELARVAVGEADRAGPFLRRRHSRLWLCAPLLALDRFEEVHSTLAVVSREAAQLGTMWPVPEWHYHRARTCMARGELRAAEVDAELGVRIARERSSMPLLGRTLRLLAEIRTARGDLGAAEANLGEAEWLGGHGAAAAQLVWRRVLWLCTAGHDDEAAEIAEGLLATADLLSFTATAPSPVAPALVRLARRRTDEQRVEQVVRVAHELSERNPGVPWAAAAAAHARGLRDRDVAAVVMAAELHRLSERRSAVAEALADAGTLACEQGDLDRSRNLLDEARRIWKTCGATPAARRAEERLAFSAGAGARPLPRRAGTDGAEDDVVPPAPEQWASLTETEARVARLVARGLTNKAIAARLTLSPHTIGTHVRNAFTKLDVNNRVELALQVIAHDRARSVPECR